jgi:hypothetical protein
MGTSLDRGPVNLLKVIQGNTIHNRKGRGIKGGHWPNNIQVSRNLPILNLSILHRNTQSETRRTIRGQVRMRVADLLLVRWQVLLRQLHRRCIHNPLVPVPLNIISWLGLGIVIRRQIEIPPRSRHRLTQTKELKGKLLTILRGHRNRVLILGLAPSKVCWMISH